MNHKPPTTRPTRECSRGHTVIDDQPYCGQCGEPLESNETPTWTTARDTLGVITHPPHLRRTLLTAAVVGTVLFCINQLDVVLAGDATTGVIIKSALTYVVPFAVSNTGILIASHRPADPA